LPKLPELPKLKATPSDIRRFRRLTAVTRIL
jgi:hypothetical protein